MDSNIQKSTFLAIFWLIACSLALVALLVIEVSTIIIDRGMTPLSCLSREVLPETPNRALELSIVWSRPHLQRSSHTHGQAPPRSPYPIVLDANQSKRITVLILLPGVPNEPYNVRGHILTQARGKFRIKELSIIYRWGGEIV